MPGRSGRAGLITRLSFTPIDGTVNSPESPVLQMTDSQTSKGVKYCGYLFLGLSCFFSNMCQDLRFGLFIRNRLRSISHFASQYESL